MTRRKKTSGDNSKVGYGKPPLHTRFKKGQSGNPNGRPRGMTAGRIKTLLLKEAYRKVQVKEGEKVVVVPAIQAILRVQLALAAKGNAPAQRAVIETIRTIEQELAVQVSVSERQKPIASSERSAIDVARRIAFVLEKGRRAAGRATQTE